MKRTTLNDAAIAKMTKEAIETGKTRSLPDHELRGLWIRATPKGIRSWCLQCRNHIGIMRTITLGRYGKGKSEIGIADARKLARQKWIEAKQGNDPIELKREQIKQERIKRASYTLVGLLDLYGNQVASSQKSWNESKGKILCVFADIADDPLLKLSLSDFQSIVDSYSSKSMARLAAGTLLPVFKWSCKPGRKYVHKEFCELEPTTKLNARKRVLSADELARILPVWRASRGNPHYDCMALLLLTVLRLNEAALLRWNDIDWNENAIKIEDTKNGQDHIVPLSRQARELLEFRRDLKLPTDLVFCNSVHKQLDNWHRAQRKLFDETDTSNWHRHDIRRSGATMMAQLRIKPHVIKAALNHAAILDPVDMIYIRYEYREEVAEALQALANKLDQIETGMNNVVDMRGQAIA